MRYGERFNICVTGVQKERRKSKQKQYIRNISKEFSQINKRYQVRNSRSSANLNQYEEEEIIIKYL